MIIPHPTAAVIVCHSCARDVAGTFEQWPSGAAPGAAVYTADFLLTPTDSAFQEIDLSGESVALAAGQGVRIAIHFQHDGLPSVATDDDGLTPDANFVFLTPGPAWSSAEAATIPNDFIIRAEIIAD